LHEFEKNIKLCGQFTKGVVLWKDYQLSARHFGIDNKWREKPISLAFGKIDKIFTITFGLNINKQENE
jgi:hypothetical protein